MSKKTFEIKEKGNLPHCISILTAIDKETGVEYIITLSTVGVTMTPRLNSDGSIYISKEN